LSTLLSSINRRIILTCGILVKEPIHIGCEQGLPLSHVDNPTFKINENPVIPGSTIKGVLRAYLTRIINSLEDEMLSSLKLQKRDEKFNEIEFQKETDLNKKIKMLKKLGSVDKLFGISGLASPLNISNAKISILTPDNTIVRPHVKIDLNTDTASKSGPFYVEASSTSKDNEDILFTFQMIFDEPSDVIYQDAVVLFDYLKNMMKYENEKGGLNLYIGGMRSRGYGQIKIILQKKVEYSLLNLITSDS